MQRFFFVCFFQKPNCELTIFSSAGRMSHLYLSSPPTWFCAAVVATRCTIVFIMVTSIMVHYRHLLCWSVKRRMLDYLQYYHMCRINTKYFFHQWRYVVTPLVWNYENEHHWTPVTCGHVSFQYNWWSYSHVTLEVNFNTQLEDSYHSEVEQMCIFHGFMITLT